MTLPPPTPAHRPARWEDLADCLAWPLLLRLPGLALRPSRLLIAYAAAIPLALLWQTSSPLLVYLGQLIRMAQGIIGAAIAPWLFGQLPTRNPLPGRWFELIQPMNMPIRGETLSHYLIPIVAILLIALTTALLSRSTALEVARGLQVSPRYLLMWGARRWLTPILCLWPIAFALILAVPPALLVMLARSFDPESPAVVALLGAAGILAAVGLLLAFLAVAAAPLIPAAAACDDGDHFDSLQRTIAIIIARPVRAILSFAWVLLIMLVLAAIARWLVDSTKHLLTLAGEHLTPTIPTAAYPLEILPSAVALSTLGTGLTLTYLYLRRSSDEQDYSEVPVQG